VTTTPDEPAAPDESYLVPDEDSDFDPEDVADQDEAADVGAPFVEKETQDDGQD